MTPSAFLFSRCSLRGLLCAAGVALSLLTAAPRPVLGLSGSIDRGAPDFVVPIGGCAGVLISPKWILTARHVAKTVVVGHSLTIHGQTTPVRSVHLSPNFRPASSVSPPMSDLGLIELEHPVTIDRYPTLAAKITSNALAALSTKPVSVASVRSVYETRVDEKTGDKQSTLVKRYAESGKTSARPMVRDGRLTLIIDDRDKGPMLEGGDSGAPLVAGTQTVLAIAHSIAADASGVRLGLFWFVGNDRDWINQTTGFDVRWATVR